MLSSRPFNNTNRVSIKNYPKIQIDRGNLIKPCVADQLRAADQFIDQPVSNWRKILHDLWHEGIPFLLRFISNLKTPTDSNKYYLYFIKALKYLALLMLHLHSVYLYIYGYFYPYSLLPLNEVCDEFNRNAKWSEAVIRSFAWHPNFDRCAVAICNDFIHIYDGLNRIRVLRHYSQKKIVDLAWQPGNKEILIVATQTSIIIWRITESQNPQQNPLNIIRDNNSRNLINLIPTAQLVKREKESHQLNGSTNSLNNNINNKNESTAANNTTSLSISNQSTTNSISTIPSTTAQASSRNFKLFENLITPPIVSAKFNQAGDKLFVCSPNSSKIAILDINKLIDFESNSQFKTTSHSTEKLSDHIRYLRKFGQGITRVVWSPNKNRLATATTSNFMRVFESFTWSCNKWMSQGVIQDMIWSRPTGRILLIAIKNDPTLYALPFLDDPQPKDVGGNKSMMKALDLNATTRGEFEELVGGCIQSFAWDKEGKRLAISFKDNPESIILYSTVEVPTVEFHQIGVIQSDNKSTPLLMDFHDNFKGGSLLTICWSDGNIQHIPFSYTHQYEQYQTVKNTFNNSSNQASPKAPRSLTNFFYVSQQPGGGGADSPSLLSQRSMRL